MYANNVILPTFAHQAATAAVTDRYLLPAKPTAAVYVAGWDKQTDRLTPDRCIDPAPHTMQNNRLHIMLCRLQSNADEKV